MPRFSIITLSFRNGDWLRLCIASIADQRVSLEHIVQDAVSDDGTLDWLAHDPRVQAFVEKDSEMYDAINRGFSKAKGDIVAYLNCDQLNIQNLFCNAPPTSPSPAGGTSSQDCSDMSELFTGRHVGPYPGGAAPPGQHAKGKRKSGPSKDIPARLGLRYLPLFDCAPGGSAPPFSSFRVSLYPKEENRNH